MTSSLRGFAQTVLGVSDAAVDPDGDALPPRFVLAVLAFAIVLSAIVTLVLVTSLQNG